MYCTRSCLWVCVFVCHHNNSKLRASIVTTLCLWVKVVTISSWLNFGGPAPPGRGFAGGGEKIFGTTYYIQRGLSPSMEGFGGAKFFAPPYYTATAQCLRLSGRFFHRLIDWLTETDWLTDLILICCVWICMILCMFLTMLCMICNGLLRLWAIVNASLLAFLSSSCTGICNCYDSCFVSM